MILDGHVHIFEKQVSTADLAQKMEKAEIDGGVIISLSPASFETNGEELTASQRLENLFSWTDSNPNLYPFFWIDPLEKDALEQVDMAVEKGIMGFKVICNHFYPGDEQAMRIYRAISKAGKPILFHSGILWDGVPSSKYNRPVEFEALLEIEGLRFSLAHASWPWCDENLAVYGKFLNAYGRRGDLSVEMFIDVTPGPPMIYYEDMLTKLLTVGYDIEDNIIFGTDCNACNYNYKWTRQWVEYHDKVYNKLGIAQETRQKILSGNLKRFLGITKDTRKKAALKVAE